jgi:hypothetical protein
MGMTIETTPSNAYPGRRPPMLARLLGAMSSPSGAHMAGLFTKPETAGGDCGTCAS